MKLTKHQLKQLIKEELRNVLNEKRPCPEVAVCSDDSDCPEESNCEDINPATRLGCCGSQS